MPRRIALAWLVAGGAFLVGATASAAPAPSCTPATMSPNATMLPVNFPGFAFNALKATTNDVHLFDTTGGTMMETPLTIGPVVDGLLKVVPTSPLTAGHTYELDFSPFCSYGATMPQGPIKFTAVATTPFPTRVGDLQGTPTYTVKDYGTTQYTLGASYLLADEMKPWAGVYALVVSFDGEEIETHATVTGSTVQISTLGWCDATTAHAMPHQVVLKAKLPFAPELQTTAADLAFSCPAPNIATPPPGNPVQPPSTPVATAGTPGKSGGCSASGLGASGSPLVSFGLVLAISALLRRRTTKEGNRHAATH
ncbi:MAG: hypothetical protein ABIP39_04885 [Polyangiaceae bacterium]